MYLYNYRDMLMYTDKDTKKLGKCLAAYGHTNLTEQLIINDMCDFLIIELLQLEAIHNEPLLTKAQKQLFSHRQAKAKRIYNSLTKHYNAKEYFITRQHMNIYYNKFKGADSNVK